mgnify:FL=1
MTTRERERLEELIEKLRDYGADSRGALFPLEYDWQDGKIYDAIAEALTALLSEMGDGWIETATNPPSIESHPDGTSLFAWLLASAGTDKVDARYVRAYPHMYPRWQPLPEGPKR